MSDQERYSKPEVERAFIGCLLCPPADLAFDVARRFNVGESWFTDQTCRKIWSAIILIGDPFQVDTLRVFNRMNGSVSLQDLDACVDRMVTGSHVHHYAEILRDCFVRRRLDDISTDFKIKAKDDSKSGLVILGELESEFSELGLIRPKSRTGEERYKDILNNWRAASKTDGIGLPTRWREINKYLGGWRSGVTYIIAGRPGQGKSTFLANEILHQLKRDVKVSLASLEMTEDQFCGRMLAEACDISSFKMDIGKSEDRDWPVLVSRASEHAQYPLRVYEDSMTINDFVAWSNVEVHHHGAQLLAVDYLQIIASGKKYESRNAEVSQWMNVIRETVKRLNVPLLLLSQLRRSEDGSDNARPKLGELRDSGSIEQNAGGVIFLYHNPDDKGEVKKLDRYGVVISKHRFGPTADIEMEFNRARQRFEEPSVGEEMFIEVNKE